MPAPSGGCMLNIINTLLAFSLASGCFFKSEFIMAHLNLHFDNQWKIALLLKSHTNLHD